MTPNTRTGNAASLQLKYYLPWHAALDGNYRLYPDTWGILAHTIGAGYTQPISTSWTLDGNVALLQAACTPPSTATCSRSRTRRISCRGTANWPSITIITVGLGASWQFRPSWPHWIEKGTVNLSYDRMHIDYEDFHNFAVGGGAAGVPLYSYDANVTAVLYFLLVLNDHSPPWI